MSEPVETAASSVPSDVIDFASKLFGKARSGDVQLLDYIRAGVSPNLSNDKGDSLLMLAAYHGHAALVKSLIEAGADPNAVNDRGQTPLAGAVFTAFKDVVQALVQGGADPNSGTPTALDTAKMFKQAEFVELFQSLGSMSRAEAPQR